MNIDIPSKDEYWFSDYTGLWYCKTPIASPVLKGAYAYLWKLVSDPAEIARLEQETK
jgi:hypothetical protein